MPSRDVAGAATEPRPCSGSDPSRLELYLDNDFGFSLSAHEDEAGISWGRGETEPSDFAGFYLERRAFLAMWLHDVEAQLGASEYSFWKARARAAFARGIELEANQAGVSVSAADVAADLIEIEIEMQVVVRRLGASASVDEYAAEYMRMIKCGLTAEEAVFVKTLRANIARAIEQKARPLNRQIAQRLRDPHLSLFSFRNWRLVGMPVTRPRQAGVRAPRSRRQGQRARVRSPGRRRSSDPKPDHALTCPRCGSGVVVLRGIRTCGTCWAYFTLALQEPAA